VVVLVGQEALAELVKLTLTHGGYVAREARSVDDASEIIDDWEAQLAILEMGAGGGELLRRLGGASPNRAVRIPCLALTRRGDLRTKLAAFEQGVDDILGVPFSPEELLARVLALTRRAYGEQVRLQPALKLGQLEIDILNRQVRIGPTLLHLTALEQSLLYYLAANAGRVLSREEIMSAIWGSEFIGESNNVDRHVRDLRAKLQDDWRKPRFIETVPGQGYRFVGGSG
jgi:DNA-binding response OmpR family regulator